MPPIRSAVATSLAANLDAQTWRTSRA